MTAVEADTAPAVLGLTFWRGRQTDTDRSFQSMLSDTQIPKRHRARESGLACGGGGGPVRQGSRSGKAILMGTVEPAASPGGSEAGHVHAAQTRAAA